MPVCIMVSVRYLNRTGIGRLIGALFVCHFWLMQTKATCFDMYIKTISRSTKWNQLVTYFLSVNIENIYSK